MSNGQKYTQILAALCATVGALIAGTTLGWTNPVHKKVTSGKLGFKTTANEFSWVGGSLPLGAAIACIPSGFFHGFVGRQMALCIISAVFFIGWLFIQFAKKLYMLYIGRLILGIACGAVCTAAPTYIGEISQKEIRGMCASFFQMQIVLGILLIYVLGAFAEYSYLNVTCMALCAVNAVLMLFMPESPTFLIKKGKEDKARAAIAWLNGKDFESKSEIDSIRADVDKNAEETSIFKNLKTTASKRAICIGVSLMFFQQFSGINAIIFYSTDIFQYAGSSLEPRYSTIVIGVVQVIATGFAVLFVDKLGRRLLLLISAAFMAIATMVLGFYFYYRESSVNQLNSFGWLPITSLCIFIIAFSFGFGPVPWITVGELFPLNIKELASGIVGTTNWLFAFIVSKAYVDVKNAIGTGVTFWIFSVLTILGFCYVFFCVPETKGKSLAEVQEILSKKKNITS